jgi:hypothetical protein
MFRRGRPFGSAAEIPGAKSGKEGKRARAGKVPAQYLAEGKVVASLRETKA